MPSMQDGRYDHTRPWQDKPGMGEEEHGIPRYDYLGPYSDQNQQIIGQALASNTTPGEYLADLVRPPLPQVQLFRSRYGYRTRELGIADIMDVDSIYAEPRTELTGGAGFEGTSRNALGNASY